MLEKFVTDTGEVIAELEQALAKGSVVEVRDNAHALRSSAANIGARRIQRLCSELSGPGPLTFDRIGAVLRAINEEFAEFRTVASAYLSERGHTRRRTDVPPL